MLIKSRSLRAKLAQIATVIAATTGAIADGMHYGWTSPVAPILRGENTPLNSPITHREENLIEILFMLGGIAGLPITIFIVDKFGRKSSILISAIGNLTSWLMLAFAPNVEVIYAARLLCGITGDMQFVAGPMYIAEIAEKGIRGLLCGIIFLALLVGVLVVYSVAPFVTVLQSSMVGATFVVIQMVTFSFMPESPYYLLKKHRAEKSEKALKFLRAGADVTEELTEIAVAVERQEKERGRPIDLFIDKGNRKALVIMAVLNAAQHFSSSSVMLMNVHTILEDAEGIVPPEYSGIIFSAVMLVSASIAIIVVDKFGRRKLLVFSSALTGMALATLATYFVFKEAEYNLENVTWIPVFAVVLFAFAFKCGLGLVPIVLTGELFPTSVKAMGMTIADTVYVIFATISLVIYQEMTENVNLYSPFYVFSISCIFTALFVYFYVPETTGKTLEEIQFVLKGIPLSEMKNGVDKLPQNGSEIKLQMACSDIFSNVSEVYFF